MFEGIKKRTEWAFQEIVSIVLNSVFLSVWALTQFVVSFIVRCLPLNGIDHIFFLVFQIFFAISTVVPIGISLVSDIIILFNNGVQKVRMAKKGLL
jgi:hypothetical protein